MVICLEQLLLKTTSRSQGTDVQGFDRLFVCFDVHWLVKRCQSTVRITDCNLSGLHSFRHIFIRVMALNPIFLTCRLSMLRPSHRVLELALGHYHDVGRHPLVVHVVVYNIGIGLLGLRTKPFVVDVCREDACLLDVSLLDRLGLTVVCLRELRCIDPTGFLLLQWHTCIIDD